MFKVNIVKRLLNKEKTRKILDAGCGSGFMLSRLENYYDIGFGIDMSPEAIEFGKQFTKAELKVGNAEKLDFQDSEFNCIISTDAFEHIPDDKAAMEEAYRVLKHGGLLITLVPDWQSNYKIYFDDFTHRTPFTAQALEDAYIMYGFSEVNVFKFRQLPIVWKYPSLNYLCAVIAPLVPVRTKNKFFRWSRELMLIGVGKKYNNLK